MQAKKRIVLQNWWLIFKKKLTWKGQHNEVQILIWQVQIYEHQHLIAYLMGSRRKIGFFFLQLMFPSRQYGASLLCHEPGKRLKGKLPKTDKTNSTLIPWGPPVGGERFPSEWQTKRGMWVQEHRLEEPFMIPFMTLRARVCGSGAPWSLTEWTGQPSGQPSPSSEDNWVSLSE